MFYLDKYLLGGQLSSITNIIYRVRDELLNEGIGKVSSAILGGDI